MVRVLNSDSTGSLRMRSHIQKRLSMKSGEHNHGSDCNHDHTCTDPSHNHSHDHNHDHGDHVGHNHQKQNHTIPIIGGIAALAAVAYLIYYYLVANPSQAQANSSIPKS